MRPSARQSRVGDPFKQRLLNALSAALLLAAFAFSYRQVVVPTYEYFGMGWRETPAWIVAMVIAMNLSVAMIAPPRYSRPSQLLFAIQYLVIFLPATVVCLNAVLPELDQLEIVAMLIAMYIGIVIQALIHYQPLRRPVTPMGWLRPRIVFSALAMLSLVTLLAAYSALKDIFALASLETLYQQRDLFGDESVPRLYLYPLSWLATVSLPALFVLAFRLRGGRRWLIVAACSIGYLVLYGLTATKTALLAPAIIIVIYMLLRSRTHSYLTVFGVFLSIMVMVPVGLRALGVDEAITAIYAGIVNFRIFSVPQLLYPQYLDFFSRNPYTFGSHITGIDLLIDHPFSTQVYLVIGEEFYPGSRMTANSGMWAQDGIAGFGLAGILLVSAAFAFVMRALDRCARGHDPRMVGAMLSIVCLAVSNTSMFTTLATGGLGVAMLILAATRRGPPGLPSRNAWRGPAARRTLPPPTASMADGI